MGSLGVLACPQHATRPLAHVLPCPNSFGAKTSCPVLRSTARPPGMPCQALIGPHVLGRSIPRSGDPKLRRAGKRVVRMQQEGGKDSSGGEPSTESLFMKELRRRRMRSSEGSGAAGEGAPGGSTTPLGGAGSKDGPGGAESPSQSRSSVRSPPRWATDGTASNGQLEKSRALNSEGIEGLIPRAWELIKLGGSFPLAFLPLGLATVGVFISVYLYFGQAFIHPGTKYTGTGAPPYVDPYDLLDDNQLSPDIVRAPFQRTYNVDDY